MFIAQVDIAMTIKKQYIVQPYFQPLIQGETLVSYKKSKWLLKKSITRVFLIWQVAICLHFISVQYNIKLN